MAAKSNTDPVKAGIRVAIGDSWKENALFRTTGLLHNDHMASMVPETRPRGAFYPRQTKAAKKESCVICFEDIDSELIMFPADECGHSFCSTCVKKYIEVKLLAGRIPNCLDLRCTSMLSIDRCRNLLTPKLNCMWRQRIIEDSTPSADRVYCPYQTCSYLMSNFMLSLSASSESGFRKCFKCGGSFCVHCMVPWHSSLSCTDYKKLHPSPLNEDTKLMSLANLEGWRQCGRYCCITYNFMRILIERAKEKTP
ncbi:PREDICTED: E3 ubiquitin-protein ligase RNF14-like [Camelina sativa]|uniref:RBR-type E3 ubiquitin transferase n=1 Tax=Camelina sativa TaxID=90675 RepID=A0ABM0XFJ4_CAMSA|nr:PREDICTED: E3 ubiquitin-protein ligase RNF14-like [Camelina sativa]